MNPTYVEENRKELFEATPSGIKTLIKGGELKAAAVQLGEKYKIQIGEYTILSNLIGFILIGALDPSNVVRAFKELLEMSEPDAIALAQDLEKGILQKARSITLGTSGNDVAVLEFKGPRSPDELRKEILDTTKRESALMKPQTSGIPKKTTQVTPGSRSQLIEQLQILSSIPNDEEVEERLSHIQEQINSIKKKEDDNSLQSNIALKSFMFGEQGKETAPAIQKTATYSVAPTHYNLDPYREVPED